MDSLTDMFNNRELAIIFWLLIFLIWVLTDKKFRISIYSIFGALFKKKIMVALLIMSIYVCLIILKGYHLQLWDFTMVKDTIYWFFGSALVLFFSADNAKDDEDYFKKILLNNAKFILVLQFIINFYVFTFWAEILLIPSITIVAVMSAVADTQAKYVAVKKVLDFILASYGIVLVIFAVLNIVNDYNFLFNNTNLTTFLLPPILTISFLPFIYFFALYMAYEILFVNLSIYIGKDKSLLHFAKRKIFQICLFRLNNIQRLKRDYLRDLLIIREKEDVLNLVQKYKGGIRV